MKSSLLKHSLAALFINLSCFSAVFAQQGVSINITKAPPASSAMLDVSATNKGLLIPRIPFLTGINDATTIPKPAHSLLVYTKIDGVNNSKEGYYYNSQDEVNPLWVMLATGNPADAKAWLLEGNAGTNPAVDFFGTIDDQEITLKQNNEKIGVIYRGGALGFTGNINTGITPFPLKGPGTKMMYIPAKAAFRVGVLDDFTPDAWDDANIGYSSFAANTNTKASGEGSTALGVGSTASGNAATSLGNNTKATGFNSLAAGYLSQATGDQSVAMGYRTAAAGKHSTTMGWLTKAYDSASTALGYGTTASGKFSLATGSGTTASGPYSTAMGITTTASGNYSTASGLSTNAIGSVSTAMGSATKASGDNSTALGSSTNAIGLNSTALGNQTTAAGRHSTSMGWLTQAYDSASTAMGYKTTASGKYSFASGNGSTASGMNSIAMGASAVASANTSIAIGVQATASKDGAVALGAGTVSSGTISTSMGFGSTASGEFSTAMGNNTTAAGENSTAIGNGTAARAYASLAVGSFNNNLDIINDASATSRLFQIGNGTDGDNRSNALTVLRNGNMGLGAIAPSARLHISSPANGNWNGFIKLQDVIGGGYASMRYNANIAQPGLQFGIFHVNDRFSFINHNGTEVAKIASNGDLDIVGCITVKDGIPFCSDIRLKNNIAPMKNVLSKLNNIQPITFDYKDKTKYSAAHQVGFSAQEIEQQFPELVRKGADGFLSVYYANMTAVAIQAVKEQQEIIENQNNRINDLESRLKQLEKIIMADKK